MSISEVDSRAEAGLPGEGAEQLRAVARALLERNRQLEQALQSRILIEQAKGILAERFGTTPDAGFDVLRRGARNHRIRVHDLARRVIEERETPAEVAEARARMRSG
jgi:AmiR/NasT family two-component response regulator